MVWVDIKREKNMTQWKKVNQKKLTTFPFSGSELKLTDKHTVTAEIYIKPQVQDDYRPKHGKRSE